MRPKASARQPMQRKEAVTSTCRPPADSAAAQARCWSDRRSRGPFTSASLARRPGAFHRSRSGMPPATHAPPPRQPIPAPYPRTHVRSVPEPLRRASRPRLDGQLRWRRSNGLAGQHVTGLAGDTGADLPSRRGPRPAGGRRTPGRGRRCTPQSSPAPPGLQSPGTASLSCSRSSFGLARAGRITRQCTTPRLSTPAGPIYDRRVCAHCGAPS